MVSERTKFSKRAFSSQTYILLLLLSIVLVFGLIAHSLVGRVQEIKDVTQTETDRAAAEELSKSIQVVIKSANNLAQDLAQWGEVNQQLHKPQYYSYWREQRLVSARKYPDYVRGIELYDNNGKVLAPVIGNNLPNQRGKKGHLLQRKDSKLYLVTFSPVSDSDNPGDTLGYVGTVWEFVPAMLLLNHFTYLDSSSIQVAQGPDMAWPLDRIKPLLRYKSIDVPAVQKLEDVALNSVLEFGVILGVFLIAVYLGVSRLFIHPLQQMYLRLAELRAAGTEDSKLPERLVTSRLKEINELSEALRRYHRKLAATSRDLDESNQELWNMAHLDVLSGVHNRRAFEHDWRAIQEAAGGQRLPIAFLLFDCDFFKAINDTYGHTTGDRLVQVLAEVLHKALRTGDKLYRLGGDEFATLLLNADEGQAHQVAERCLESLSKYPMHDIGIQESVMISIGLAVTQRMNSEELKNLPRQADLAMYHAKRDKHRRISHYSAEMDRMSGSVISSRAVSAAIDAAKGLGGIEMHYQPIVNTQTGQVIHYESLVRINDNQGLIFPGDIFPIIDQRSLQVPFDLNIMRSVCDDIQAHHLPKGVGVSINMSAHTLMLPNLLEHLAPLLPLLEEHTIIIEVTETDLITQLQHVTENLAQLREYGVIIALDDFGSGYSSIRYLARMPVDIVKFDIEMIRDLESDASRRSIVENAARMVREAGYQLIAEGIETTTQRDLASSMGATHLQGYLFGKPERTPHPATISNTA